VRIGASSAILSIVNYKGVKDELAGVEFGEVDGTGNGTWVDSGGGSAGGLGGGLGRGPAARAGVAGRGVQPPADAAGGDQHNCPEDQKKAMQQIIQASQRAKEEEIRLWWLDRMVADEAAAGREDGHCSGTGFW